MSEKRGWRRAYGVKVVGCGLLAACLLAGCGEPTGRSGAEEREAAWLHDLTDESGLDFVHETGASGELLLPEIMTSGVALLDHDGDGDLDVYFTTGNHELDGSRDGPATPNRLYRRDAGGVYVDVTETSGLGDAGYGMGVAVGDIDNDGDRDLYLTRYGNDRLFLNRGDGTFAEIGERDGLSVGGWSCSSTFFDYDRDGLLDLYVTRYVRYDRTKQCTDAAGRISYCSPKVFPAEHDVLLHNEGGGRFRDVSQAAGIRSARAAGLGVVADDFDGDGWPDIYVANDGYANQLWINQRDGTFRDDAALLGAAYNMEGETEAGMGVVAADFDNDLDIDLFMTHLDSQTNTYYSNRGAGNGFEDATGVSGLASDSLLFTGFGTAAFDIELDGDLDLVVVNGRVTHGKIRADAAVAPPWDRYAEPNFVFLNQGDARFVPSHALGGDLSSRVEISRGLAVGDLDDDGDLDLLITNAQSRARLYRNDAPRSGNWLLVRAVDPRYNRDAIGARVVVVTGETRRMRTISRGFSYLSSSDARAHFGLGPAERVDRLEVRWLDGLVESFVMPEVNRQVELLRGQGQPP